MAKAETANRILFGLFLPYRQLPSHCILLFMGKGTETTTHKEIKTDEEMQKKTKTQR